MGLLPQGKADFLLFGNNNSSPDVEYIINEKLLTYEDYSSISIPAVITRAVHNLNSFSSIEAPNLKFDSKNAKDILVEGMAFGREYELKGNYLVLEIECLSGLQNDISNILDLGYDSEINNTTNFEKLLHIKNKTLIFCAGFLLEASRRFHIVLSSNLQTAASLLIADKLREDILMRLKHNNITLTENQCLTEEKKSDMTDFLSKLSYTPHIVNTTFDFNNSEISTLREYDYTQVGTIINSSAALAYGATNQLSQEELLNEIEILIYSM